MATTNPFELLEVNSRERTDIKVQRSRSRDTVADTTSRHERLKQKNSSENIGSVNCNCARLKLSKFSASWMSDCEVPRKYSQNISEYLDFDTQVIASDIQPDSCVQTSSSLTEVTDKTSGLQLQRPEQPRRCPNRLWLLAANKCLECHDCEEKSAIPEGQPHEEGTQTECWCVSWPQDSQTGPSLTAVGPFSRFDYRLKKARSEKCSLLHDCCKPLESSSFTAFTSDRELNSHFQQQVDPLDISVSETVQTEQGADIENTFINILCGSCDPAVSGIFRNKIHSPLDYTRFYLREERCIDSDCCFAMQVSQEDISPTKLIQTDPCLLFHACRRSRRYSTGWVYACALPSFEAPQSITSVAEIAQQVTATDIGDSSESQTCWSLMTMRPFCVAKQARGVPKTQRRANKRTPYGTEGDFRMPVFDCCCPAKEKGIAVDASSQVNQTDLSTNTALQTCDQSPNLVKCYIRRQQWACRSWC